MNPTITIKNLDVVRGVFKMFPMKMTGEIQRAISKSILTVERNIKREAPVNKQTGGGNLRQSIRSQMTGMASGKVEANAKYAIFVEGGTRPHTITVRNKRVLANRRTGQIFGRVVNHPGTQANPFFQRGVDASKKDIDRFFITAVQNALK